MNLRLTAKICALPALFAINLNQKEEKFVNKKCRQQESASNSLRPLK